MNSTHRNTIRCWWFLPMTSSQARKTGSPSKTTFAATRFWHPSARAFWVCWRSPCTIHRGTDWNDKKTRAQANQWWYPMCYRPLSVVRHTPPSALPPKPLPLYCKKHLQMSRSRSRKTHPYLISTYWTPYWPSDSKNLHLQGFPWDPMGTHSDKSLHSHFGKLSQIHIYHSFTLKDWWFIPQEQENSCKRIEKKTETILYETKLIQSSCSTEESSIKSSERAVIWVLLASCMVLYCSHKYSNHDYALRLEKFSVSRGKILACHTISRFNGIFI